MKKRLKKWTLENVWTPIEVLHQKQSSEFMIPGTKNHKMWRPPVTTFFLNDYEKILFIFNLNDI